MASNLARRNSVTDSVKERRLRPLYDLLDSGNCKKVLTDADKLLKKHPSFSCAKIIKSLAYMRLGKMEECMTIMQQVTDELPTDEGTLHAMSICYRELDLPEKVCGLYETACKVDKTEDHMTSWFLSHVRILDFPNQHKVAMQLYKTYSKGIYLLWAIMSLYGKALIVDEPEIAQSITLPLAAKMVAKYIDDNPLYTETDVYLYIMILFRMGDYGTALSVLEGARDKVKCWTYSQYSRLEMTCLMKLKDEEKLAAAFERNILHDPSDFKTYRQYIDAFGLTRTDHLIAFFKGMAYDDKLEVKSRTALLALILLAKALLQKNMKPESIEIRQLFIDYFKKYGTKPFFLRDMKNIFKYLKDSKEVTIITSTMEQDLLKNTGGSFSLATILQWKTNFECVSCVLKQSEILSDQTSVLGCVSSIVKAYKSMGDHFKSVRSKSDSRDNCPYEELLVTCCLLLMKTFWSKQGFWTGYYINSGMSSLNVGQEGDVNVVKPEHSMENGLLPSPTTKPPWFEGEFPIVLNMVLLEFGALSSPFCYPHRLLLGKTYFYCGAADAGLEEIMKMDIKHMQIDSLGYLYMTKVLEGGVVTDARRVMAHADSFYGTCTRELVEHIISAYKNVSWHQVLEFMGFREAMLKSAQAGQIKVEKRLFEYTMDGNTRENILKVAQRDSFDFKSAFTSSFEDNRDFSIHSFMFESIATDEYRELTFKDDVEKLKLRASILGTLTHFVRALSHLNDSSKSREHISKAKEAFEAVILCVNNKSPKEYTVNVEDRCFFGPWPPNAHEYTESHMVGCLQEFFSLVMVAGSLTCKENSLEDIKNLYTMMDGVSTLLLDTVNLYISEWSKIHISLINMSNFNEELFQVVETFGFISILVDVLKGFLEKIVPPTSETKGKKRKSKDNVVDAAWTTQYNSLVEKLLSSASLVEGTLADLEIASRGWYPKTWSDDQEIFWKNKVSDELLPVVRKTLPIVCEKLSRSFLRAFAEMKTTILNKKHFVETLTILN